MVIVAIASIISMEHLGDKMGIIKTQNPIIDQIAFSL